MSKNQPTGGAEVGAGGGLLDLPDHLRWLGGGGTSSPPPPPTVDVGPPAEHVRFAKVDVPSPYASSRVRVALVASSFEHRIHKRVS